MALSYRSSAAANGAATTATTVTVTLPSGTSANDIVYIVGTVGIVYTNPVNPSGWTVRHDTNADATGRTFLAYRTIRTGDTSPIFSWTTAGKTAWTAICVQPAAGQVALHAGIVGPTVNATATTHTSPAFAAGGLTGCSVLMTGYRGSTNVATAIATTDNSPANWTESGATMDTSTATGTTAATRQVAARHAYRVGQTGTITPTAQVVSVTALANLYHVFAVEQSVLAAPPMVLGRAAIHRSFYW